MSKRTTQPKAHAETTPASGDVNAPVVQYKFSDGSTIDLPMSEVKARRDAQVAKMIESDDAELHFEGLRARDRYALLDRAMQEEHEAKLLQRETEQAAADSARAASSAKRKAVRAEQVANAAKAELERKQRAASERAADAATKPRPSRGRMKRRIQKLMARFKNDGSTFKEFMRDWEADEQDQLEVVDLKDGTYKVVGHKKEDPAAKPYKLRTLEGYFSES